MLRRKWWLAFNWEACVQEELKMANDNNNNNNNNLTGVHNY